MLETGFKEEEKMCCRTLLKMVEMFENTKFELKKKNTFKC